MGPFVSHHFILKRMTAKFNALPLNLSHQPAFSQYNLTGPFLPCSDCVKCLHHQKVDTALNQSDHRLIQEIIKTPADVLA